MYQKTSPFSPQNGSWQRQGHKQTMNETLSLEEAHRTRQIGHRQAFDVEEALKEKVKELKSVDDSMKDNDMQGQCQTVQKLDKRCLHLENSIQQTYHTMGHHQTKGASGAKTYRRRRGGYKAVR